MTKPLPLHHPRQCLFLTEVRPESLSVVLLCLLLLFIWAACSSCFLLRHNQKEADWTVRLDRGKMEEQDFRPEFSVIQLPC